MPSFQTLFFSEGHSEVMADNVWVSGCSVCRTVRPRLLSVFVYLCVSVSVWFCLSVDMDCMCCSNGESQCLWMGIGRTNKTHGSVCEVCARRCGPVDGPVCLLELICWPSLAFKMEQRRTPPEDAQTHWSLSQIGPWEMIGNQWPRTGIKRSRDLPAHRPLPRTCALTWTTWLRQGQTQNQGGGGDLFQQWRSLSETPSEDYILFQVMNPPRF